MKRLVAILFVFTMLLQAIPVLHFVVERSEIFYTNIDEDKPGETKAAKEKKEAKEIFALHQLPGETLPQPCFFVDGDGCSLPSPFVASLIHPPDVAC